MRTYIVLRSDTDGANLQLVELCEANGSHQAIKRSRDNNPALDVADADEEWHAVPVRNWTTISVVTETPAPRTTFPEIELVKLPTRAADPSEPTPEAAPEADPPEADALADAEADHETRQAMAS